MFFASFSSGSSGNCLYISTETTHLLVDVGLSCKKIVEYLEMFGVMPEELSGILITHEHSDHIQSIGTITKKYKVPIYTTIETFAAIKKTPGGKGIPLELMMNVSGDEDFSIGDINVKVCEISHDAAHPVCYRFSDGHKTIGMATDLGVFDDRIVKHLSNLDLLYLESNYDYDMLMVGPYPYYLKQRIDGERGHLSNDLSAELCSRVLHSKLKHIVLAHLSKENNFPEIAYQTHINMLNDKWLYAAEKPEVLVAKRDTLSITINL